MVDTTQDIYVDTEISSLSDWEIFLPTYVTIGSGTNTGVDVRNTIGYEDATLVYEFITTNYGFGTGISSFVDTDLTWTVATALSGTAVLGADTTTTFDYRNITYSGSYVLPVSFLYGSVDYIGYIFVENELVYLDTMPALPDNTFVEVRVYIGVVDKRQDTFIDLTLSNSKIYKNDISVICADLAVCSGICCDIENGTGRVGIFNQDLYNSLQLTKYIDTDLLVSTLEYGSCNFDVFIGTGTVGYNLDDLISANQGIYIADICDIRTWSLEISNFFLTEGSFCEDTATMYVDLTDTLYSIETSDCYFKIDGSVVSVTLSGIAFGYRMFYDPIDNYATKGTLVVTAHTKNNMGDILEQDFYLLHGYDVQYIQREMWPPVENIFIRMAANNETFCVNTAGDSFYFETVDLPSYSLGASIHPVSYVDLVSTIHPQSTAFFYGGSYTVRISNIKDYNGNVLEDVVFSFEIENPIS